MTLELNITLSQEIYQKLEQYAHNKNLGVAEAVAGYLAENPPTLPTSTPSEAEQLADLRREKKAFLAMHPVLHKQHKGQYVAIYQGALLDHDDDYGTLYERVRAQYPHQIIWISKIQDTPLPEIVVRSPRLEPIE